MKAAYEKKGFICSGQNLEKFLEKFVLFVKAQLQNNGVELNDKNIDRCLSKEILSYTMKDGFYVFSSKDKEVVLATHFLQNFNGQKLYYVTLRTNFDQNKMGDEIETSFAKLHNFTKAIIRGCLYLNLNFDPNSVHGKVLKLNLDELTLKLSSFLHLNLKRQNIRKIFDDASSEKNMNDYQNNPFFVDQKYSYSGTLSEQLKNSSSWVFDKNSNYILPILGKNNVKSVLLTISIFSCERHNWNLANYKIEKPVLQLPMHIFSKTLV